MTDFLDEIEGQAEALAAGQRDQYRLSEFYYDLKNDVYWCTRTKKPYLAVAVNAMIPRDQWEAELLPGRNNSVREVAIKPSSSIARIERNSVVEDATWWPGRDLIINDLLLLDGGDKYHKGLRTFNTYEAAPLPLNGNSAMAALWVEHIKALWPEDWELLLDYFAHTVQFPERKINYGIVLLGEQGIGKDSALVPVRKAIGEWNCKEIVPDLIFSQFTGWRECVLLIINEARPTAEDHKATEFYEQLKVLTAAPPEWLHCNGKYKMDRYVRNIMRVIITANDHLSFYIPENDRRIHFAKSKKPVNWADRTYFQQLYDFYAEGGLEHVHSFLLKRDVSKFNPNKRPAPNAAWEQVVDSWSAPLVDVVRDIIEDLGWPVVFFSTELLKSEAASFDSKEEVMGLLKHPRKLAGRMYRLGYDIMRAPNKSNGFFFSVDGKKFRSKIAFMKHGFEGKTELALDARGREIAETGKAKRSNILPMEPR